MKVNVISPSYKRAEKVRTHTVVPGTRYAVHEFEAEKYAELYGADSVVVMPDEVQGNIARVRNWILANCLSDDAHLLMVDDDMMWVGEFIGNRSRRLDFDGVGELIEYGFHLAEEFDVALWGVNLLPDKGGYREYTPFSFVNIILGPWLGVRRASVRFDESLTLKEDYDFAIAMMNVERGVLRINWFHYMVDHQNIGGGCPSYRTMGKEVEAFRRLQKKWGSTIVRRDKGKAHVTRKKNVLYDVNPVIRIPIVGV